jgi:hypothetical protein
MIGRTSGYDRPRPHGQLGLERPTDDIRDTQSGPPGDRDAGAGRLSGTAADRRAGGEAARPLRAQLGATRDAAKRLLQAHRDLAAAELAQVLDEVKRLAILAGIAIGALVLLGIFFPIGLLLFLGEWLFGSIGWGVLHGTLFLVAVALAAALVALGVGGGVIGRSLIVAVVIGLVVGGLLAFNQPNVAWTRIGEAAGLAIDPGVRPLVVGTLVVALVLGALGLVLGAMAGGLGGAIAGLLGGAVLGAILGAFSAITFGAQAGAAIGVAVALLAWPVMAGISLARGGLDMAALKARFWPSITIETSKETIEWLRAQTPMGPKS